MKQAAVVISIIVLAFAFAISMALLVQNDILPFWGAMGIAVLVWAAVMVFVPRKKSQ